MRPFASKGHPRQPKPPTSMPPSGLNTARPAPRAGITPRPARRDVTANVARPVKSKPRSSLLDERVIDSELTEFYRRSPCSSDTDYQRAIYELPLDCKKRNDAVGHCRITILFCCSLGKDILLAVPKTYRNAFEAQLKKDKLWPFPCQRPFNEDEFLASVREANAALTKMVAANPKFTASQEAPTFWDVHTKPSN